MNQSLTVRVCQFIFVNIDAQTFWLGIVITDLDLFTESDDEHERESEEGVNINPILLDCIRNKELGEKSSPHPNKATSTALVLFKPLPGLEQLQRGGVTQQVKLVDENAMDLEP